MVYLKISGLILLLSFNQVTFGQKPDSAVSLKDALLLAEKNYPFLKSKQYETEAAKKNITLSRNTLIPSLDVSYQVNLATYNNITGMFNSAGVLPISGPPSTDNKYQPVFGSAAGFLLNWQAITFGQRNAQVDYSKAEVSQKEADQQQELFKHQANVINTYLDAALTKELLLVYQKNIERLEFALKASRTLTASGLKPGVDTALFQSEISKGRIDWLGASKSFETQKIILSQLLAVRDEVDTKDSLFFSRLPQTSFLADTVFNDHPLIKYSQSLVDYSRAKEKLFKRSYMPKLNIWSTTYARGSGIKYDGVVKSADGLGFSRYNYGIGVQLAFPLLKYADVKLQTKQQNLITQSIEQRREENLLLLVKQNQVSETAYNNALLVVKETATQLRSAAYAYKAMQIRYNTGLVNFTDLIQAQYNLLKAETDAKQSYWYVWKALLNKAMAQGDMNIFLNELK